MKFSERIGLSAPRSVLQLDSMDSPLRNGLWNVLYELYFSHGVHRNTLSSAMYYTLWKTIWRDFFKTALDALPSGFTGAQKELRDWFFAAPWHGVYDFIEFVAQTGTSTSRGPGHLVHEVNIILKREMAGYTMLGTQFIPITSSEELAAINTAIQGGSATQVAVSAHLNAAIDLFSDRTAPDYRNSIKESISAVEAVAKSLASDSKAELGKALKALEGKVDMHPALDKGFRALYGYASDAGGIRHAMLEASTIDAEDARYMLVACSAFVNYLRAKARKANIPE